MEMPITAGIKNNPSAAMAAVNPSATDAPISPSATARSCADLSFPAACACSLRKTLGTTWNTEPLPMPVVTNSNTKLAKNQSGELLSVPVGRNAKIAIAATSMTAKFQKVTLPPPRRSDNQPPSGRTSAPSSGPTKAQCLASEGGEYVDTSCGNAAANPMNEPKVPV